MTPLTVGRITFNPNTGSEVADFLIRAAMQIKGNYILDSLR